MIIQTRSKRYLKQRFWIDLDVPENSYLFGNIWREAIENHFSKTILLTFISNTAKYGPEKALFTQRFFRRPAKQSPHQSPFKKTRSWKVGIKGHNFFFEKAAIRRSEEHLSRKNSSIEIRNSKSINIFSNTSCKTKRAQLEKIYIQKQIVSSFSLFFWK